MHGSPSLLLQVSYLKGAPTVTCRDYCMISVSCPPEWFEALKRLLLCSHNMCSCLFSLLLMLSGDIESNPGPMSKAEADAFSAALETMRKLEESNETLMAELKCIKERQAAYVNEISALKAKFVTLESKITSQSASDTNTADRAILDLSDQMTTIESRCNDAENRQRRSNLLFFGIADDSEEDWAKSEEKVINFCSQKLGLQKTGAQFDRVHRLGRYKEGSNRPVIAKFTFFKDKQEVLSSARKLKGTTFSISEDFSLATRQKRKKLYDFAKTQNVKFYLAVDSLRIDKKTCVIDSATNEVVLSTR
ncbi:hypothetical protein HPB48_003454 [Haemaphysalis longicornis]|uniref:Uncharacterized protein n=1 Tax=Haemaphysalis longicornis TaxID=44386 RepID=A0A9J6G534_HAELO|nr:hypothetical protein HPB48_003454 [Haemaphysalis longicornis]